MSITLAHAVITWKPRVSFSVEAVVAARELDRINIEQGGITAPAIVEAARPVRAVLHPAFEWDDVEAARLHREERARLLTRSLIVVQRSDSGEPLPPTRYIVEPLRRDDAEDEDAVERHCYLPILEVMGDPILRHRYVAQALRELGQWREKYANIRDLAALFDAIDGAQETTRAAGKAKQGRAWSVAARSV